MSEAMLVCAGAIVDVQHEQPDEAAGLRQVVAGGPDRLSVIARLFAETSSGERLAVARASMGVGLWHRGISAIWKQYVGPPPLPDDPAAREQLLNDYRVRRRDVEDAINQLLGRDPEQHRPPRLSWDPLINRLAEDGIDVTEEQLIALPFSFEFSPELLAELAPDAS
jgi:hypothetical protein